MKKKQVKTDKQYVTRVTAGLATIPEWETLTDEEQELVRHPMLDDKEIYYPLNLLQLVAVFHIDKKKLDKWVELDLIRSLHGSIQNRYKQFYSPTIVKLIHLNKLSDEDINKLAKQREELRPKKLEASTDIPNYDY